MSVTRSACAIGLASVLFAACVGTRTPAPADPTSCVEVPTGEQIYWAQWAGKELVVGSASGPFASGGQTFRARAFDRSTGRSAVLVERSSINGLPAVGPDETLWWVEHDGVWMREASGTVRRVRELDGGSVYALSWTRAGTLVLIEQGSSERLDLVDPSGTDKTILTSKGVFGMWASPSTDTVILRGSDDGRTAFLEIRSRGTTSELEGLPRWTHVAWAAGDSQTVVIQVRDEGLFSTPSDRTDLKPLDIGVPRDVTVVSDPSADGRVAFHALSGMRDEEVCVTAPIADSLRLTPAR